jgi:hypothetical protein
MSEKTTTTTSTDYDYNEDGVVDLTATVEHGTDGTDVHTRTSFDEHGNTVSQQNDFNGDGFYENEMTPHESGVRSATDYDQDGTADHVNYWQGDNIVRQDELDDAGNIEATNLDTDLDGARDTRMVDTNSDGRFDQVLVDVDDDQRSDITKVDTDFDGDFDIAYDNHGSASATGGGIDTFEDAMLGHEYEHQNEGDDYTNMA